MGVNHQCDAWQRQLPWPREDYGGAYSSSEEGPQHHRWVGAVQWLRAARKRSVHPRGWKMAQMRGQNFGVGCCEVQSSELWRKNKNAGSIYVNSVMSEAEGTKDERGQEELSAAARQEAGWLSAYVLTLTLISNEDPLQIDDHQAHITDDPPKLSCGTDDDAPHQCFTKRYCDTPILFAACSSCLKLSLIFKV